MRSPLIPITDRGCGDWLGGSGSARRVSEQGAQGPSGFVTWRDAGKPRPSPNLGARCLDPVQGGCQRVTYVEVIAGMLIERTGTSSTFLVVGAQGRDPGQVAAGEGRPALRYLVAGAHAPGVSDRLPVHL